MTEERSWTVACSLGSLGLMSCKSRAEDFARRLHTKLKTLGGLAHEDDAEGCVKTAAEPGEHNRLVDVAADSACLPQPVQTCLTEDDDLFYDFDLDSPDSPAADQDLLHLNPCDSLCNGGEEIRRKGGGGGGVGLGVRAGNGVATTQPVSVMRETELYCPCAEHRGGGVGCRLMSEIKGDMSPPTPIAYTPPEELPTDRESAYCSSGEQETSVLGQGQSDEGLTRALLERFSFQEKENDSWNYEGIEYEVFKECKDVEGDDCKVNDAISVDNVDIDAVAQSLQIDDAGREMCDGAPTRITGQEGNVFFGGENCMFTCDNALNEANNCEQYADDVSKQILEELVREACIVQKGEEIGKFTDSEVNSQHDVQKETDSPVSPTWGSLKKIDRFQVRQLVTEDGTPVNNTELENNVETICINDIAHETKANVLCAKKTDDSSCLETEEKHDENKISTIELTTTILLSVLVDQPSEESPLSPISAHLLDDRPRHIYRSSSLKTGKTPPGTPGRKKIVRFADVFGLDLEDVRHVFLDDLPQVPQSAYSDLDKSLISTATTSNNHSQIMSSSYGSSSASRSCSRPIPSPRRPAKSLIPMFPQPCSSERFMDLIREQKVCLESAHVADVGIAGSVRVMNLAFHKAVIVRYTLNEWRSFLEVEATFVPGGSDKVSDRFTFNLYGGETLGIGERIVFCIRYHTLGQNFWDNNHGQNYFFQCIADNYQLPPSPLDTWDLFL